MRFLESLSLGRLISFLREHIQTKEDFFREDAKTGFDKSNVESLFRKITFQISDFWGVSREAVAGRMPHIKIAKTTGSGLSIAEYNSAENSVTVNEGYLNNYDSYKGQLFNSLEPALAEESCHFIETIVKSKVGVKEDGGVKEFFGILSRLYIAESMNIARFKEEYKKLFEESMNFTQKLEQSQANIDNIFDESDRRMQDIERQLASQDDELDAMMTRGASSEDIESINVKRRELLQQMWKEIGQSLVDIDAESKKAKHLSYYPAYSFYHHIKKMRPVDRLDLLRKKPDDVIEFLMAPQERRLENLRRRLSEVGGKEQEIDKILEDRFSQSQLETKNYVETGQFFENIETEAMNNEERNKMPQKSSLPVSKTVTVHETRDTPKYQESSGESHAKRQRRFVLNVSMSEKEMKKAGIKF